MAKRMSVRATILAAVICIAGAAGIGETQAQPSAARPDNATCLGCHGAQGFDMPRGDGVKRSLFVDKGKFDQSVHGKMHLMCVDCHQGQAQIPHTNIAKTIGDWRKAVPELCATCHPKQKSDYLTSVHADQVFNKGNPFAAVCSDCHSAHAIDRPAGDSARLAITQNCGGCHGENLRSFMDTYHGKIATLGYAYTAKCFDCHGNHDIKRVNDPASTVHPDNRLKTCQKCHTYATAGYATYQPHANTHDFARYPYTWLASKFMLGLLGGTFAFFWTHSALWFYREHRERKEHKMRPHVVMDRLPPAQQGKYFLRWPAMWRIAHLLFAISLMTLVLTGMTVFYADSFWAPYVVRALGGPQTAAFIHRICASVFVFVFVAHLIYMIVRIGKEWRTFDFFGPNSMIPRLEDLWDALAMFKWFFGLGPKPQLDRWTYWEKFDYWAPFWGVTIIGVTGFMMWFPNVTASFLPGWVFNVAVIAHGEEAVLAAGFLFTVHFFNNHFRPDKFPLDIVMFTGAMPLDMFKQEHGLEYQRLAKSGELEKYLVDAPSQPMTLASTILGYTLIAVGLFLLVLVMTGFVTSMMGH